MANYEKQVEQEAAYPIPISLYNCYRTVRHEKRYQEYIAMPLFSCLTVLQQLYTVVTPACKLPVFLLHNDVITGGLPGRISGRRQGYACRVVAHEPRRAL